MLSKINAISLAITCISFLFSLRSESQVPTQAIKGEIFDSESLTVLAGAAVTVTGMDPPITTTSTDKGFFVLKVPAGRISLKISFVGYDDKMISDILVTTGKEVELQVAMKEKLIEAKEIFVTASRNKSPAINQMATVSVSTIRTDDALRFAGGFYDPSRIVNAFAGIVTANSDESNNIVIRGNSSRVLLWSHAPHLFQNGLRNQFPQK